VEETLKQEVDSFEKDLSVKRSLLGLPCDNKINETEENWCVYLRWFHDFHWNKLRNNKKNG